jgi:hypothetical protein
MHDEQERMANHFQRLEADQRRRVDQALPELLAAFARFIRANPTMDDHDPAMVRAWHVYSEESWNQTAESV